jgi:HTH-type transcriptional regulator / antitoxin HipB
MKHTPESLGKIIRQTRRALKVTQRGLALTSGTGLRFIIELEKGKPSAHLGKVLNVLQTLGITIDLIPPSLPQAVPTRTKKKEQLDGENT